MKPTPNHSKNNDILGLKHQSEYLDFILWIATPNALRKPKTQAELAKKFGVGQDTLSEWKTRPDFWTKVVQIWKQWGRERTPDVILALYNKIIKTGDAAEAKLWLQLNEGWSEKIITLTTPTRKYANLTNQELADRINALKDKLLKRK